MMQNHLAAVLCVSVSLLLSSVYSVASVLSFGYYDAKTTHKYAYIGRSRRVFYGIGSGCTPS